MSSNSSPRYNPCKGKTVFQIAAMMIDVYSESNVWRPTEMEAFDNIKRQNKRNAILEPVSMPKHNSKQYFQRVVLEVKELLNEDGSYTYYDDGNKVTKKPLLISALLYDMGYVTVSPKHVIEAQRLCSENKSPDSRPRKRN